MFLNIQIFVISDGARVAATRSPFGVAIRVLIRTNCLVQDRFRKHSGFPSSVAFCYSAQVAVSSCGLGLRTDAAFIH